MPKSSKSKVVLVNLTFCGPDDVSKEIKLAEEVVYQWNRLHGESRGFMVKHRHWSTDTYPDGAHGGQEAVNLQIIDDASILVAIFWSRIGSATRVAKSGTIEEIERGIKQGKKVLIYFSDLEPIPANADRQQFENLQKFRRELRSRHSCWSFQSRDRFHEQFAEHLALVLNAFEPKPTRKNPKKNANISQVMRDGVQVAGNVDTVNNYQRPPVIKTVLERRADSVSPEEEHQIAKWIEDLAENTIGKPRREAFAEWNGKFQNTFKAKRDSLRASDMGKVEKWYRVQRVFQKEGLKTRAPDQWRNAKIGAIKTCMKKMGKVNASYYEELSDRLNMKRPFSSLTKLTKADLERVYRIVLTDAKKS